MSAPPRVSALAGRTTPLPEPVGPLTEVLFEALRGAPDGAANGASPDGGPLDPAAVAPADPLADLDLQLALYVAYELHYAGFEGVDERWEWAPSLLAFRAALERPFEAAVDAIVPAATPEETASVPETLQAIVAADDGPPLSRHLETKGTREQMLEHVIHRSAYQLKEADPHSWGIPRLAPAAKAALLEVQFDEYGGGRAERMHAVLFANTMAALGLDPTYGAYLHLLPAPTLATVNLLSGFGLHRRRRGALVGHLAAFEMTSSIPNRRYGNALRRLGCDKEATDFYDEHVEADAVHEMIAAWDLAGGLAREDPAVAADILFGARALLALEARWAAHLLGSWEAGETSLRGAPALA
ncbi:MAG TPA: iron-containing redox enzyme family protein [Solirubrobacterales bacterium]|nr:iron-containing redox enzyme family protein [Solirubrobacterales bacterium]